jgi:hypothetical protein
MNKEEREEGNNRPDRELRYIVLNLGGVKVFERHVHHSGAHRAPNTQLSHLLHEPYPTPQSLL